MAEIAMRLYSSKGLVQRRNPTVPAVVQRLESRCLLSDSSLGAALEPGLIAGPRLMENLGRGVVAVRASSSSAFVSWRLLALDPAGVGFNVYRSANSGAPAKLNGSPLTGGTNFTDTSANFTQNNAYFVRPVIGGVEQLASGSYTLPGNSAVGPFINVPLRDIGNYSITHVSVGDLDGDGEYDFVVGRAPASVNEVGVAPQVIEAYRSDGSFLWSVNCGPNSLDVDNIEPGSSAIDVGNWDGVTVYDLDGDGRAEVFYRSANGVVFGDGSVLSYPANNDVQFISVLNGMTGAERARVQIPTDYLSDGPLAASLGIGYLDGVHPSLVAKMKNRIGNGSFNLMVAAWDFNGTSITQKWKFLRGNANLPDGHQIRIVDVDQNGTDEIVDIGYVLNGNGTLKYEMASRGIVHGDRFHIGDLDPDRPGLEGYGVQQDNPSLLYEYYYDAATGEILHAHYGATIGDVGRGIAADIDPSHRGYEYWSFSGIYNSNTPVPGQPPVETQLTSEPNRPWPNFRIWWDGDTLSENLNNTTIDKWNPATQSTSRVTTLYHYGSPTSAPREAPVFYGDIMGDWREEVIFERSDHTALQLYTTMIPSSTRLYTLAQNPEYRNCMTVKGYYQSNMVDYYLGDGMSTPPTPNIAIVAGPDAPQEVAATVAGLNQIEISWLPSAGAASYAVYRSNVSGGPYTPIAQNLAGSSYLDTTAANGTTYYYIVSATGGTGIKGFNSSQASATIPVPSSTIVYPAESASIGGGSVISTTYAGFNGTGYIDAPVNGGFIQFNNVGGGQGGSATLNFRYALATGQSIGYLYVNGVPEAIVFNSTGAWTNWSLRAVNANLNPGTTNTIRLESIGSDLGNLDEMQVVITGDGVAPTISSSTFEYSNSPNKLNFTFSEDVMPSLGLSDLVVTLLGPEQQIAATAFDYDPGTYTATYTLPTGLADGNYRATFASGGVIDAAGNPLGAFTFDFFILAGDANHDRKVDLYDLVVLATNWQGTGRTFSQGDFDYNGVVNSADLGILATHWQQNLNPPPSPPSAPVPTSAARRAPARMPVRTLALVETVN